MALCVTGCARRLHRQIAGTGYSVVLYSDLGAVGDWRRLTCWGHEKTSPAGGCRALKADFAHSDKVSTRVKRVTAEYLQTSRHVDVSLERAQLGAGGGHAGNVGVRVIALSLNRRKPCTNIPYLSPTLDHRARTCPCLRRRRAHQLPEDTNSAILFFG